MTGQDNTRLGIFLMILVTIVFSVQDGISQHLASRYNVIMVVMIRYWFFAAFVIALAQRQPGGVRQVAVTSQLPLQFFSRGFIGGRNLCDGCCFHLVRAGGNACGFCVLPLVGRGDVGTSLG